MCKTWYSLVSECECDGAEGACLTQIRFEADSRPHRRVARDMTITMAGAWVVIPTDLVTHGSLRGVDDVSSSPCVLPLIRPVLAQI